MEKLRRQRTWFVLPLLATVACTGSGSATSPTSVPAGSSGITYDNIQVAHHFIVGSPVPTQDQASTYCCWPLPVKSSGTFVFNLAGFPLNGLPSGGASGVLSSSEMILVGIDHSPADGAVTFEWHKAVNGDRVVYTFNGKPSFSWSYSFIGHFSWEISEAGGYYTLVRTPWGDARVDFLVTSTSAITDSEGIAPVMSARADRSMPRWHGGGGGGGGAASSALALQPRGQ